MAPYELRFRSSVAKDLRDIPRADVQRILARIEALRDDPRPPGSEKLSAQERYRVRQGDYRILYTIDAAQVRIETVKVGHRREVYREPSAPPVPRLCG
jgi:mRNA interferase RelE/StbE